MLRGDKQMFLNQRRVNYPFIGSGLFDLEPLPPVASQRKAEAPVKRCTNLANKDEWLKSRRPSATLF
ncbi:hypothetical protein ABB05_16540 [Lederbergia galactosidilytica]|uniref:Uncharacterized protein n=1 Tax=Lederbergia galactosidilytica TaxID=217031 RepID=A0A177ZMR5_9BACI|nr:hypothetical protein ABB05_16540 [Lederbergia galactosidilytica]